MKPFIPLTKKPFDLLAKSIQTNNWRDFQNDFRIWYLSPEAFLYLQNPTFQELSVT